MKGAALTCSLLSLGAFVHSALMTNSAVGAVVLVCAVNAAFLAGLAQRYGK